MSRKNPSPHQKQVSAEVAQAYNQFGEKYHQARKGSGLFFNEFLEVPATLEHLPANLVGMKVFDAGCGSGLYSVRLAQRGAKVCSMDLSETMIRIAKEELPSELQISYQVGDICQTPFETGTFDMVLSNYVLENIEDLSLPLNEFFRLLKPNGVLLFSVSHPIRSMAERDKTTGLEHWILKDYFSSGTRESDLGNGLLVTKFKHHFSTYINAVAKAGFKIELLDEPRPTLEGMNINADLYKMGMRLPQLMIIKATKHAAVQDQASS